MRSTKTLSAEGTWTRGSGILRLREDLEHRETSRVIIWNVRPCAGERYAYSKRWDDVSKAIDESVGLGMRG